MEEVELTSQETEQARAEAQGSDESIVGDAPAEESWVLAISVLSAKSNSGPVPVKFSL